MAEALDLYHASRDESVALVVDLRERLADAERRLAWQAQDLATLGATVAELTARVGELLAGGEPEAAPDGGGAASGPPRGTPGRKPGPPPTRAPKSRRRRARGFGRRRMAPTARRVHAVAECPCCRVPLAGGAVARTREVIEVPLGPAEVTEHVYLARRCPRCGGRWQPGPGLEGVVVGQGRLGVGLLSLIAWLREEARLPFATVRRSLAQAHGLSLSVGALVAAVRAVAARAEAAAAVHLAAIRASPVVHADETGWREGGHNGYGYAWTLSTPEARYFVRGTRERAVLEEALGEGFAGVLVSDFYAAYTGCEGARHQYCWAHLLRDADELARQHPRDAGVRGWADALRRLFGRARAFAAPDPAARVAARQRFEAELAALCAPALAEPSGTSPPQAGLCRRVEKHLGGLFVFVEDPAVPPTNNAAERSLRHLVVCRKISGGTRSAAGTDAKMALASLFGTWRARGLDPLEQCRLLLAAPQL
jgi:transposase